MQENRLFAFLATCDGDQPRVRPVSPVVENDMSIWVTTFATSRKVKRINENPKICLAFVLPPQGEKAAIVVGEAKVAADIQQKKRGRELANFDLSQYFPRGQESNEFCLLRVNIRKIEWWDSWEEGGTKTYEP